MTNENSNVITLTDSQFIAFSHIARFLVDFLELVQEQDLDLKASQVTSVVLPLADDLQEIVTDVFAQLKANSPSSEEVGVISESGI